LMEPIAKLFSLMSRAIGRLEGLCLARTSTVELIVMAKW